MSDELNEVPTPVGEPEQRRKALTRFALDFLKANLEDLDGEGFFEGFDPAPTEDEIDQLKHHLGVYFS